MVSINAHKHAVIDILHNILPCRVCFIKSMWTTEEEMHENITVNNITVWAMTSNRKYNGMYSTKKETKTHWKDDSEPSSSIKFPDLRR